MKTNHSIPLLVALAAIACSSNKPTPAGPSTGASAPAASAATSAAASAAPAASSAAPVASSAPSEEEENEVSASAKAAAAASKPSPVAQVVALPGLFDKTAKKDGFPKATDTDKDCYRAVSLAGKADKDYEAVLAKCGAGTGMKEYVKKVSGKFDEQHRRDTYSIKMVGGLCYRFWAVSDSSVGDIDIRVQTPRGALVSMDQSKHSVAILDPDEPWCKKHDREFHFVVESAKGNGNYVFGVWARPK
jgi:hypothetical protein